MISRPRRPASAVRPTGRLTGEERAAAVARTYARGPRRLLLSEGQLRHIAAQESARQESARRGSAG